MSDLPTVKELEEAALARDWQPFARLADAWVSGRLVDREATDDMEKMWVCLFDGLNDLCEQGKMTSKHQELCGEFWLLPVAAAIGDTDEDEGNLADDFLGGPGFEYDGDNV